MTLARTWKRQSLLAEMKIGNWQPDVITYNTLLEKVKKEKDAIFWITEFCSTNLIPDAHITNSLKKIFALVCESSRLMEMFILILRFNPMMFFIWLKNFEDVVIVDKFTSEYPNECNGTDFNKLGFATHYLLLGELVRGKEWLDSVAVHNFYYFKYSGDYYCQIRNEQQAENNYKRAFELSEDNNNRQDMLDKISSMIKLFKQDQKIERSNRILQAINITIS